MKGKQKAKRVPQRTCVICRMVMPKRNLIRIVRTPEGKVAVDPRGKLAGRGAYLCAREGCFAGKRARDAIARALEIGLPEEEWLALGGELVALAAERAPALSQDAERVEDHPAVVPGGSV